MKNQQSIGNISKRFAAFAVLTGSLVFSTEAFSKPECDALHKAANKAGVDYVLMANACTSIMINCPALIAAKFQKYVEADAAWRACEEI